MSWRQVQDGSQGRHCRISRRQERFSRIFRHPSADAVSFKTEERVGYVRLRSFFVQLSGAVRMDGLLAAFLPAIETDILVIFGILFVAFILFTLEPIPIDMAAIGIVVVHVLDILYYAAGHTVLTVRRSRSSGLLATTISLENRPHTVCSRRCSGGVRDRRRTLECDRRPNGCLAVSTDRSTDPEPSRRRPSTVRTPPQRRRSGPSGRAQAARRRTGAGRSGCRARATAT